MNTLCIKSFSDDDRIQFAQLIGYSVGGFQDLSYVDNTTKDKVYALVDARDSSNIESSATDNYIASFERRNKKLYLIINQIGELTESI